MADIYDGEVWKSFLTVNGEDFLLDMHTLGLCLNVDWFRPFKHVEYSVGAMYITVLNFPRSLRYLRENVILVGVLPGPHEPSLQMNAFLEPLVRQLLKLWSGVEMVTSDGTKKIRAALLCTSSDIPASRKLTGFVGHAATKGCSRCLKSFLTSEFGSKPDYSGFNHDSWMKRDLKDHQEQGMKWKHSNTLAKRHEIEKEYGIRYTELLRLLYFDTIRFTAIDPMHNIFLGSAKHMAGLWKSTGFLNGSVNGKIQEIVDKFCTPPDVGRIPYKIASGFSSFTADQWKNWTLIFSLVILKDILPDQHYWCWWLFVQACSLISSRAISYLKIDELDSFIIRFCEQFEQIYGKDSCTPNLHLHGHLIECYKNYGPSCSFWLFAFERMNGILGSVSTNHQSIEIQLMRKFLSNQQVLLNLASSESISELQDLFHSHLRNKGSLKHEEIPELPIFMPLSAATCNELGDKCKLSQVKEGCFDSDDLASISVVMRSFFGDSYIRTLMLHRHSSHLVFQGVSYGCHSTQGHSSSMVYASLSNASNLKPAVIRKFVAVSVILKQDSLENDHSKCTVFLARIDWLCEHEFKNFFGLPAEVWQKYRPSNRSNLYIPVVCIKCRCAYVNHVVRFSQAMDEEVTIVVPINHFSGL